MMMTTQFFNSTQNSNMMGLNGSIKLNGTTGSAAISKTIAQAKLRKARAQRGNSNPPTQFENNLTTHEYNSHARQQSLATPGGMNPSSFTGPA